MKVFLTIWAILALSLLSKAQDIHFSQFFFAPQLLSPAEIGNFNAAYRFNANQKTQWREVTQPYSTFDLTGDARLDFLTEGLAAGAVIMNDRAGDSRFNTFSILLGGSYIYTLPENDRHSFTGGIQTGLTQIKLNYDELQFNNQFNGVVYDPSLPNGENFARNARWYLNLNFGITYRFRVNDRKTLSIGYAGHNVTTPDQSFFNDTGVNLPYRSSIYVTADWQFTDEMDVMPVFRWMDQSTFNETIFGSAVRYRIIDEGSLYRAAFLGYYGRFGDSGIAMIGAEIDAWRVAASYDINVSDLEVASRNQGGFEFSVQYLIGRRSDSRGYRHKFCPVFL